MLTASKASIAQKVASCSHRARSIRRVVLSVIPSFLFKLYRYCRLPSVVPRWAPLALIILCGVIGCDSRPKGSGQSNQSAAPQQPQTAIAERDSEPGKEQAKPEATPDVPPVPAAEPEQPQPVVIPPPYVPAKILQTGTIFNGLKYNVAFETVEGKTTTLEREDPDSYTVEVRVKVRVPKPHQSLEELSRIAPQLAQTLPALPELLRTAKVSHEFEELYRIKTNAVRANVNRLDVLLSRHNFFDCETILELQHPQSKRKALLIQADMDVDTDGSDGDRVPTLEMGGSKTFQPFTSYRWAKRTTSPNPFLSEWERRLRDAEAKVATARDPAAARAELAKIRAEWKSMQSSSWLVGAADPFIVLPLQMVGKSPKGFGPLIGDYCVVIVGDKLFPAIIGDAGPTTKLGEASLRICREVAQESSGTQRAVSDLKVTYLVFPGTGDKPWGPPDLVKWTARCTKLLAEMGGYNGTLVAWTPWSQPTAAPAPVGSGLPVAPPSASLGPLTPAATRPAESAPPQPTTTAPATQSPKTAPVPVPTSTPTSPANPSTSASPRR